MWLTKEGLINMLESRHVGGVLSVACAYQPPLSLVPPA
jgi:hypothetical protein